MLRKTVNLLQGNQLSHVYIRWSFIKRLTSYNRELRDLKHRAQASREERDTLNAEQQQLLKEKSKLELTIKVSVL